VSQRQLLEQQLGNTETERDGKPDYPGASRMCARKRDFLYMCVFICAFPNPNVYWVESKKS
jgi:hypothetical protein